MRVRYPAPGREKTATYGRVAYLAEQQRIVQQLRSDDAAVELTETREHVLLPAELAAVEREQEEQARRVPQLPSDLPAFGEEVFFPYPMSGSFGDLQAERAKRRRTR